MLFTGLAIIPESLSAATLLLTMTILMLIFSAIVDQKAPGKSRLQRTRTSLVLISLWLTPLLACLAIWALWLRIADYGWTVDRIYGAVIAFIAFAGSLLVMWFKGSAWSQGVSNMNTFIMLMLVLAGGSWFLLHSPVIDPWRIMVKSQQARYEKGEAKADAADLYVLSTAGRRGKQLLLKLNARPQWLKDPVKLKSTLIQILAGHNAAGIQPDTIKLRQAISLRPGNEAPPENWWQAQKESVKALSICMVDVGSCLVWMQDLNNDGMPEVLLYIRHTSHIIIYTLSGNVWRRIGIAEMTEKADSGIFKTTPNAVAKVWPDLEINGQHLPVKYYTYDVS